MIFSLTRLLLLLLSSCSSALAGWEMNDLSILFPLPAPASKNLLWRAGTSARDGTLLPRSLYSELPMLVVLRDREWLYQNLRVVALRIDPCFREGTNAASLPCRRQVRLVWQPLEEVRGSWTTLDAAVHTFHELDEQSWRNFRDDLKTLRTKHPSAPGLPLQVNPRIAQEGWQGGYAQELSHLVLSTIGPANLVRATAMTVNTEGTVWVFTGFDVKNGTYTRIPVPRTKNVAQAFFAKLDDLNEYRSTMNPFPAEESPYLRLLQNSAVAGREMGETEIMKAVRSSLIALNPRRSNPGTIDCASCHAARAVPLWAASNFPNWNWDSLFGDNLFRSGGNLENTTAQPRRTNMLRAFGYFNADPVISPRTVFETALATGAMGE